MNEELIAILQEQIALDREVLENLDAGSKEWIEVSKVMNEKVDQLRQLLKANDEVYLKEQEIALEDRKNATAKEIADGTVATEKTRTKTEVLRMCLLGGITLLTSIFGYAVTKSAYEVNTTSYKSDPDAINESKEISRKGNLLGKL